MATFTTGTWSWGPRALTAGLAAVTALSATALPGLMADELRVSVPNPTARIAPVVADVASSVRLAVAVGSTDVIVRTTATAGPAARAAVIGAGGVVTAELELVGGFGATIGASALSALEAVDGLISVTLDGQVEFLGKPSLGGGGGGTTTPSVAPYDHYYPETIGAEALQALGFDGSGVGIAIIDTGIAEIPDFAGRIVAHQDMSSEANNVDGVGHGTFLAGLAAGDGAMSATGSKRALTYPHRGVAPGAHLIDVKVASANGDTNLITILAALQWVHHNRNIYDIDVVNLSFGTVSEQATNIDPLNFAVQQLWRDGIVVVTAAGNLGEQGSRTITKPADDPFVITVGAADSRGTVLPADDQVPGFSSRGPALADGNAKPDVIAPGRSVVGPVAPGSTVSTIAPAIVDTNYVRGSGTSFASAITAGAVALLLDAHPNWTPNQVKGALMATAAPVAELNVYKAGRGIVNLVAANALVVPPSANGGLLYGSAVGDLAYTLGDVANSLLQTANCTIQGLLGLLGLGEPCSIWFSLNRFANDFNVATWEATQFAGHQWYDAEWYGHQWYGHQWYSNDWS